MKGKGGYKPGFLPRSVPGQDVLKVLEKEKERDRRAVEEKIKKEKFKNYMHAFMSIISLEGIGCTLDEKNSGTRCEFKTENGWDPTIYFNLHLKMLKYVQPKDIKKYVRQSKDMKSSSEEALVSRFKIFVDQTIEHAERLVKFNNTSSSTHFDKINNYLNVSNKYIIYPWITVANSSGSPGGHQIYINLLREDKSYTIKISDLGYGRTDEPDGELKPIQLRFNQKETFDLYIHFLTKMRGSVTSLELYKAIYGRENENICNQCIPDIPQKTGNFVVKNLLDAIKQDAVSNFGKEEGILFFQALYLELLKITLRGALRNNVELAEELKPIDSAVSYIKTNQESFTKLTRDLVAGKIKNDYQALVNATKPVLPIPDIVSTTSPDLPTSSGGYNFS